MRRSNWAVAVLLAAGLIGTASLATRAADEKAAGDKAASSATEKPAKKGSKAPRLTKPWADMSSLSDDQKMKIVDIHKKSLDEKKAIDQKEHEAIMALLNDDQKAEAEKHTASAKKGGMKKNAAGGEKSADGAQKAQDK
jgi:Spy/CpxP family protein refolding chaperone